MTPTATVPTVNQTETSPTAVPVLPPRAPRARRWLRRVTIVVDAAYLLVVALDLAVLADRRRRASRRAGDRPS